MIGSRGSATGRGVSAGIVAGLVWGLAFLLPVLVSGWNAVTVTAGRYLAYGALSAALFLAGGHGLRGLAHRHWKTALAFAVTGNVGYYLLLVVGIRTAGAPVTDVVIGCIPITLALVGNRVSPAYPWRRLILSVGLVTAGLAVVNALEFAGRHAYIPASIGARAAGLGCGLVAVAIWTWYALANARFLAVHRDVSPRGWATVMGVATGAVTLAALPLAWAAGQLPPPGNGRSLLRLVVAAAILGVLVSWAGTWLWNAASSRLSPTLAGVLINVETVSGFAYVYAAHHEWPPPGQLAGLALVVVGVALVVPRQLRGEARECRGGIGALRGGKTSDGGDAGEPPRREGVDWRARKMSASDWNRRIIAEFRANGGKVGGPFERQPLLLLHHQGARSGTWRVNPLAYQRLDDGALAVFGSKGGSDTHPDWYHNVRANPGVRVDVGSQMFDAVARVAEGEERDRIWEKQKLEMAGFADYERKTRRRIPVVILERVAEAHQHLSA